MMKFKSKLLHVHSVIIYLIILGAITVGAWGGTIGPNQDRDNKIRFALLTGETVDQVIVAAGNAEKKLSCCTISNFKMGKFRVNESGNLELYEETTTIPYIAGTYFGIIFNYETKVEGDIQYNEEVTFPSVPDGWTTVVGAYDASTENWKTIESMWHNAKILVIDGDIIKDFKVQSEPMWHNAKILVIDSRVGFCGYVDAEKKECRAAWAATLSHGSGQIISCWRFNPSNDPIGQWKWTITLNKEHYGTVNFSIKAPPAGGGN